MTARFENLVGTPQYAAGAFIVNVVDSPTKKVIHGLDVSLFVNGSKVGDTRTDGEGNAVFTVKITQPGAYTLVAYASSIDMQPRLLRTPSVSKLLGIRYVTVECIDSSENAELGVTTFVKSSNGAVDLELITPVTVLVPTEMQGNDTVTTHVPLIPSNVDVGMMGDQNEITQSLATDVKQVYQYLPFKQISIVIPNGSAYDISGDPMSRLANIDCNKYKALLGSTIQLTGHVLDQYHQIVGWRINNNLYTTPDVTIHLTGDVSIELLVKIFNVYSDISTFDTDSNGWNVQGTDDHITEYIENNNLIVSSPSHVKSFGVAKSYDLTDKSPSTALHVHYQYEIRDGTSTHVLYMLHGAGVQFNENGDITNEVHAKIDLGKSGVIDQDLSLKDHPGGAITLYLAATDTGENQINTMILGGISVSYTRNIPLPPAPACVD